MKSPPDRMRSAFRSCLIGMAGIILVGCTTRPTVDWNARLGSYTFDQAVIDLGPPDKQATLSDGGLVAEWMTRRGSFYGTGYGAAYYGHPHRPYGYYPGYAMAPYEMDKSPDQYLRLVFDPERRLSGWNQFAK